MTRRRFRRAALSLAAFALGAAADTVVLRNGSRLDGVIEEEDAQSVLLRIDAATVRLPRGQVASVECSGEAARRRLEEDWAARDFSHPSRVPPGLEALAGRYRAALAARQAALNARRTVRDAWADTERLKTERRRIGEAMRSVGETLLATSTNDPAAYNVVAAEWNGLLERARDMDARIVEKQSASDAAGDRSSGYIGAMLALREERAAILAAEPAGAAARAFLDRLDAEIARLTGEIESHRIPMERHGELFVVTARLNDRADVRLILDTGATDVVLAAPVAGRLGLDVDALPVADVRVGGGQTLPARHAILDAVAVDGARASGVSALFLTNAFPERTEGVLGMSFLRRFVVRADPAAGHLDLGRWSAP
jgi:clan AA aspartic protease (TIGR02281 family)